MSDLGFDELAEELSEFAPKAKRDGRSARDERIIAGFEEIQRFALEHRRAPQHGEDRDIFERLYAVRLGRLRAQKDCRELLIPLDHQGLLTAPVSHLQAPVDDLDEDALFAELEGVVGAAEVTTLTHVRSHAEKRESEEIAAREKCEDFEQFRPLFERVQRELKSGLREAKPFLKQQAAIKQGELFIIGGQIAYVAAVGEEFVNQYDRRDSRLRVIYDNGTESNVLLRSLQRALHRDVTGRRITNPSAGPLFGDTADEEDLASGTIYVLRSLSNEPTVAAHRDLLHKIGVTGGNVEKRIADAKNDPTYLLADVEIVAEYQLYNINRVKLENVIHRVFAPAQLDIHITDRFGKPVVPREWFLVPLFAIDEAVARIKDGTIADYIYDPHVASLVLSAQHET